MYEVRCDDVRPPAVADMFYPGNPTELSHFLDDLFGSVEPSEIGGEVKALVSPHAGYPYSGKVAARGYKSLPAFDNPVIAVIAPSHRDRFYGVSVFNGKGYETPLGVVPVAVEQANALIQQHDLIRSSWLGHRAEHALEVQLPFLQKKFARFSIIPIVMGEQTREMCEVLAQALTAVLELGNALIVATSDLSHFHPDEVARQLDGFSIRLIEQFNPDELAAALESGQSELCGSGPVLAAMMASRLEGADAARALDYRNSGDATGDYSSVVGYLSAVFYKSKRAS